MSEYGDLLNVKPMTKPKYLKKDTPRKATSNFENEDMTNIKQKPKPQLQEDLRKTFLINDNTSEKDLLKKMHHYPTAYFLFDPEGHYVNAMGLHEALRKNLTSKYYGAEKKKQKSTDLWQDGGDLVENEKPASFKNTPFAKCELPYEVFHTHRKITLQIKQYLSRMGFLMLRDGSLEVKDSSNKKPELADA